MVQKKFGHILRKTANPIQYLQKSNTKEPWACDYYLYKGRHLVECFFQKLKWFRRIATRYDTLDASFLSFVYLTSIMILLK